MKPQVNPEHYKRKEYDSKERFCCYWHQIDEIINLNPKEVLEIGIGSGFVSRYLQDKGIEIKTLDIEEGLKPDIKASVLKLPFAGETFELIACFEVLEHLPYKNFTIALSEIFRVSKRYLVLSLPHDISRIYRFNLQLPKVGEIKKLISLPLLKKPTHKIMGGHHWEIGKASYSLKRINKDIEVAGFKIIKTYRVFELPYHRFFVLKKAIE